MSPHCWNHKTSSTKKTKYLYLCQTEETWVLESCCCDVKSNVQKKERREEKKTICLHTETETTNKIKILSFVYFDEIGFEEQIVKYLPNLVHIPVCISFFLCYIVFPHFTKVIWMSLVGITSSLLVFVVCSGWPWFTRDCRSWGSGTVILAMYTFIVGPWLPASSAISADLIHNLQRKQGNI